MAAASFALFFAESEAVGEQPTNNSTIVSAEIILGATELPVLEVLGSMLRRYGARELSVKERSGASDSV